MTRTRCKNIYKFIAIQFLLLISINSNEAVHNQTNESFRKGNFSSMGTQKEYSITKYLRKLIGANCVPIERGVVTPYYNCIGCVVEEATGCIDDMRNNVSGNVAPNCNMGRITESYETKCCPRILPDNKGNLDLKYVGAAYPMALRCLKAVGCEHSIFYTQLLDECKAICPINIYLDQKGGTACLAQFNAGKSNQLTYSLAITSVILLVTYLLLRGPG